MVPHDHGLSVVGLMFHVKHQQACRTVTIDVSPIRSTLIQMKKVLISNDLRWDSWE